MSVFEELYELRSKSEKHGMKTSHPRNCRHCTHMVCGDANWCSEKNETMSDAAISAHRKCSSFEYNPIDALTLDGIDDGFRAEREMALYEKRMRGDWS